MRVLSISMPKQEAVTHPAARSAAEEVASYRENRTHIYFEDTKPAESH